MKYCSLCNNPYDDTVKNCQLSHCISCGSTRLHTDKSMQINPIAIMLLAGIFGIIFWALIFDKMDQITFVISMFSFFVGFVLVNSLSSSKTSYLCLNCLTKGFMPITKALLQDTKTDKSHENFPNVDPTDIARLVGSNLKFQNKLDAKVLLLVAGAVIALIGLIFGDVIKTTVESGFNFG